MNTLFGDNGILAQHLPGFEPRPGQKEMAEAVAALLASSGDDASSERMEADCLAVEAETGLGKTLAYLVPAVLSGRKVVVSTNTRNLQDQILKREIPFIQQTIDPELQAICVKGRQNYLCLYRWYQLFDQQQKLREDDQQTSIQQWIEKTEYGDRAELSWLSASSPLWQKICCQSHFCLGGDCPESSRCFLNRLRKDAARCRLLIVNHHLLFSDLAVRKSGYGEVLPRYEAVIFDEAHHLENVATTFFGHSFSRYQLLDLLGDIERDLTAMNAAESSTVLAFTASLQASLTVFGEIFPKERGRFALNSAQVERNDAARAAINSLARNLESLADALEKSDKKEPAWEQYGNRCHELAAKLDLITACFFEDDASLGEQYTYWGERTERNLSLHATPVDVSGELQATLYTATAACVFTSATLKTGDSFDYFARRLGFPEDTATLTFPSPFDYKTKTLLYVPKSSFPEPSSAAYPDAVHEQISQLVACSKGRALVLFTSFKAMEAACHALQKKLAYTLLMQGEAPRHILLDQFSRQTQSILLGVSSFWEGVDIPGESLSLLIIDKLPFEVPSDPVIMARINAIKQNGANPFSTFQVPRAIISLRQGVGRLMRKSSDSGVIAILDTRLCTRGYGKRFLQNLPPSPITRELQHVADFFHDHV
ncbi:MAG: ATP-dependent helicase [Desulfobulbus propionicus]|nr:MAG: ATP-dependent helicase [Desulfobulbus propionicus]